MKSRRRTRALRIVLGLVFGALIVGAALGCGRARAAGPGMIVLGMDGLDYELTRQLMAEGRLPNFARLAEMGAFQPLETSLSPQSPVAWSNFITGLDSGGHGIFDFLHRDLEGSPLPFGTPRQATSREVKGGRSLEIGGRIIPLSGFPLELMRRGEVFWSRLQEHGIESTIVRMPANYPPVGEAARELTGMGTPDLRGTSGTFTFYSTDRRQFMKTDVTGGEIFPADVVDGVFEGTIYALDDNPTTVQADDPVLVEFTVFVDAEQPVAKIEVGDEALILREGEWSDWVGVDFELIPYLLSMSGTVRFYLKSVRPEFELYITPVQIDPADPSMPIAEPLSFATELTEAAGRFWTQEMPEDTKAMDQGVFDVADFVAQTSLVRREALAQYAHLLERWSGGFLFYYFGSTDQVAHELWGVTLDPTHPQYDPAVHDEYRDVIPSIYEELDGVVGATLDRLGPEDTLVVMSDHGFASWRRSFNLNTWLVQNGYMRLEPSTRLPVKEFFTGVEWSATRAYGLGLAGLYLNLRGRESKGLVAPGDRDELLAELERELLAVVDPATGQPLITRVYIRERDFHDRGNLEIGPDIIVGYAKGVRGSGAGALGGIPTEFVTDNLEEWSGDHIMDHTTVPGVLFTSRPLARPATSLQNLAAALLAQLGIEGFPDGSTPVTVTGGGRD